MAADLRPGAKLPFRDRAYTYDGLNRLVNEARSPVPSGTAYTEQHLAKAWELDMLGNWGRHRADIEEDGDASDAAAIGSNQVRSHNRANEIEDPSAQYDAANQNASGTVTSRYYRFAYDDAGNMTDERSGTALPIPPTVMAGEVMTYDAWNRLVATEHRPSTGSAVDISEHSYNALGWRVSKRMDSSKGAYDGLDQERVFLYDASWRMIEEWVDTNLDGTTDSVSQQFWGLRYIDDAVAKRVNRYLADDWVGNAAATTWYQITDTQFSVVAVLDSSGDVYERVEYDAYGNARHRFRGDVTGDGVHTIADYNQAVAGPGAFVSIGHADYHVDYDLNFDGTTDAADIAVINSAALTPAQPDGWISDPSSTAGPDNSIGYCGYVFNPEREDYTVRHRVLSPRLGRWRTRDPLFAADRLENWISYGGVVIVDDFELDLYLWKTGSREAIRSISELTNENKIATRLAQHFNRNFTNFYSYTNGAPILRVDPLGLLCQPATGPISPALAASLRGYPPCTANCVSGTLQECYGCCISSCSSADALGCQDWCDKHTRPGPPLGPKGRITRPGKKLGPSIPQNLTGLIFAFLIIFACKGLSHASRFYH